MPDPFYRPKPDYADPLGMNDTTRIEKQANMYSNASYGGDRFAPVSYVDYKPGSNLLNLGQFSLQTGQERLAPDQYALNEGARVLSDANGRAQTYAGQGDQALEYMSGLGAEANRVGQAGQQSLLGLSGQTNGLAQAWQNQSADAYANAAGLGNAQQSAYGDLLGLGTRPPAYGQANAQLAQGYQTAAAQNLALARSGRGNQPNVTAYRQALTQNAFAGQQMAGQQAVIDAQNAQAWQAQQLQAMQAAGSMLGGMRGQDTSAAAAQAGLGAQYAGYGLGTTNAGYGLNLSGQHSAIGAGRDAWGQQSGWSALGEQITQGGEQQKYNILQLQGSLEKNRQLAALGYAGEENALSAQKEAATIGGVGAAGSSIITAATRPPKKDGE